MAAERFQILSLDGGGLRGIFSAAILARLEEDLDCSIVDHFDLLAGTSTGGIIALALGLGMSPRQIVEFYTLLGPLLLELAQPSRVEIDRAVKQAIEVILQLHDSPTFPHPALARHRVCFAGTVAGRASRWSASSGNPMGHEH